MAHQLFTLNDGTRLSIDRSELILTGARDTVLIDCSQITGVRRGATDLIITRREADPLTIRAASLDDARAIEQGLAAYCAAGPLNRRRWNPDAG